MIHPRRPRTRLEPQRSGALYRNEPLRATGEGDYQFRAHSPSAAFHEWITVVTDREWLVYLDRKLILRKPKTQSAGHPPLYLLFNLAVGGSWFGNVSTETDLSRWEMNLRSIEIYGVSTNKNK